MRYKCLLQMKRKIVRHVYSNRRQERKMNKINSRISRDIIENITYKVCWTYLIILKSGQLKRPSSILFVVVFFYIFHQNKSTQNAWLINNSRTNEFSYHFEQEIIMSNSKLVKYLNSTHIPPRIEKNHTLVRLDSVKGFVYKGKKFKLVQRQALSSRLNI